VTLQTLARPANAAASGARRGDRIGPGFRLSSRRRRSCDHRREDGV